MADMKRQFGIVGLGRMGANLALQALEKGIQVVGFDVKKYWARAIAMMRHGFGGHPYGADQSIVRERREGRVGDFLRE